MDIIKLYNSSKKNWLQLVFLRLQKVSEMGATATRAKSKPVQLQPMVWLQSVAVRFGSGLFPVLWTGL